MYNALAFAKMTRLPRSVAKDNVEKFICVLFLSCTILNMSSLQCHDNNAMLTTTQYTTVWCEDIPAPPDRLGYHDSCPNSPVPSKAVASAVLCRAVFTNCEKSAPSLAGGSLDF